MQTKEKCAITPNYTCKLQYSCTCITIHPWTLYRWFSVSHYVSFDSFCIQRNSATLESLFAVWEKLLGLLSCQCGVDKKSACFLPSQPLPFTSWLIASCNALQKKKKKTIIPMSVTHQSCPVHLSTSYAGNETDKKLMFSINGGCVLCCKERKQVCICVFLSKIYHPK